MFQASFERFGGDRGASAGFTLIEVLAALAVAAVSLSAIGALMAGNVRGSGKIAQHLGLLGTLRAVETGLPDRASLMTGNLSGDMHGHAWSVDIVPFPDDFVNPRADRNWTPQTIVITVQSPSGGLLRLATVRLAKVAGAR